MPRHIVRRRGIWHERRVEVGFDEPECPALLNAFFSTVNNLEHMLREFEADLASILATFGLPGEYEPLRLAILAHDHAHWLQDVQDQATSKGIELVVPKAVPEEARDILEALRHIGFLRQFVASGNAEQAAVEAVKVIQYAMVAKSRWAATPVERDQKAQAGRKRGGRATGEGRQEDAQDGHTAILEAAQELLAEGRAPRDLAGILAGRFRKTPRHIRRILARMKRT